MYKKNEVKTESVEQFLARGGKVQKCAATPVKGKYETNKSYHKRTKKQTSIQVEHIPAELQYLVVGGK